MIFMLPSEVLVQEDRGITSVEIPGSVTPHVLCSGSQKKAAAGSIFIIQKIHQVSFHPEELEWILHIENWVVCSL